MAKQFPSQWRAGTSLTLGLFTLGLMLSSCPWADGHPLQSNCLQNHFEFDRVLEDDAECSNFGYSDCGNDTFASKCVNYCAFSRCQISECSTDSDCASLGDAACVDYTVSDVNYGKWCDFNETYGGSSDCGCICTCINAGGSNCSATCGNSN